MNFSSRLLLWYSRNKRALPWRASSDPYIIWVSEVILQQTRMDQGVVYFNRFMASFPTLHDLANASEDKVLRVWQGLGYYSRARNLHAAAKEIVANREGVFPKTMSEWMQLKGVGPYTAAAIASMAFGEAVAALDGNVYRILARLFAIDSPMDTSRGKQVFHEVAGDLIDMEDPGGFNQAMMDFGSLVCKPANPDCINCIFNRECLAFLRNAVSKYPIRKQKERPRERYFNYFLFFYKDSDRPARFYISKRSGHDIWKNLYELPLLETKTAVSDKELMNDPWLKGLFPAGCVYRFYHSPTNIQHKLTHQTIHACFYKVMVNPACTKILDQRFIGTTISGFQDMAKPRLIERFIEGASSSRLLQ